jgi:hypothetical protein
MKIPPHDYGSHKDGVLKYNVLLVYAVGMIILLLLSGCSWGPLSITHKEGHMPKGQLALPFDGRLRVSTDSNLQPTGVNLVWKKSFQ